MKLGGGVEWGLHTCLSLAWLDAEAPVPAKKLAEIYDLPPAYLAKQLQALVRGGIVSSTSGPRGGYRLARQPADITLLDVVDAIEGGRAITFTCTEIRRRGLGAGVPAGSFSTVCSIAAAMLDAEDQWRAALAATTLADLDGRVATTSPGAAQGTRVWLAGEPR